MAPIRTAIIGLSSSATTSWASAAHLPYLLSPRGREKYQIVALCNSTVEAARRAILDYQLPAETKAYGDPQALADDDDVELVVCCTRVDVHHSTSLPCVKAGKSVFVEWPLAQNLDHVKELVTAARDSGSRSLVGIQGRVAPPVVKVRELLEQGRIGKVLSSEVRAAGGTVDRETLAVGIKYFTERSVGGNVFTIGFGHLFDQVQHALGELEHLHARFQLQRPEVKLCDLSTERIVATTKSNVPDLIIVSGSLKGSKTAQEGASLLVRFRRGQPFPGEPGLSWTIHGEKGEIRVQAQGGPTLHATAYTSPVTIEVHDFESNEVHQVEWEWQAWQEELPIAARSVAVLYDGFAEGVRDGAPSFETALVRHEQLARLFETWDKERWISTSFDQEDE